MSVTDKPTRTTGIRRSYEMLLARIETLRKALVAAANCIDELARSAINAKYTIDKLYAQWDKLEGLENEELEEHN